MYYIYYTVKVCEGRGVFQSVPIDVGTYRDRATGAPDGRIPYGHDLLESTTEISTLIQFPIMHPASSLTVTR